MRQQRVIDNLAFGIEAYQYLQFTAKAHGSRFNSSTDEFAFFSGGIHSVLDTVYLLSLFFGNRVIVKTRNHGADSIAQRLGIGLRNRFFRQFIYISQQCHGYRSNSS